MFCMPIIAAFTVLNELHFIIQYFYNVSQYRGYKKTKFLLVVITA